MLWQYCRVKQALSTIKPMRMKPDSRALGRGALGGTIDGRSREGRFVRRIEAELIQQLGGVPSFGQLLLVRRAARAALKLELYDQKLASSDLTDHDSRMYGGLSNNLRLLLRELGLKAPSPDRTPSLRDIVAEHARGGSP